MKKGLPKIEGDSQKQTRYFLVDCVRWFIAYKTQSNKDADSLRDAQIRKLNLEADRIELEVQEKRKEIIEIAKISQIWSKVLGEFKTRLILIPKRISALFDSIRDANDLESLLGEDIHHALTELSRAENLIDNILEDK